MSSQCICGLILAAALLPCAEAGQAQDQRSGKPTAPKGKRTAPGSPKGKAELERTERKLMGEYQEMRRTVAQQLQELSKRVADPSADFRARYRTPIAERDPRAYPISSSVGRQPDGTIIVIPPIGQRELAPFIPRK